MKLLLVAAAAAAGASAVSIAQIDAACARLLDWYDWPSGLFTSQGADSFWTTANAFETLANYQLLTGNTSCGGNATFEGYLAHSLQQLSGPLFTDAFRDDHLWWTLAFARTYESTGNTSFLDAAERIYGLLVGPWQAWNTTCGGINWDNDVHYVNSITNELFLSASTKLHLLTADRTPVTNFTYLGWAETEWEWFSRTPLLQASPRLYTDGLSTANCSAINTGGSFWTYNQGVFLSGLAQLAAAQGSPNNSSAAALVQFAADTAEAAFAYFGAGSAGSVLQELSCGPNGNCTGLDGRQFKGVLVRHTQYALPAIAQAAGGATASKLAALLASQAASILANDALPLAGGSKLQLGQFWQGPFQVDSTPFVSQGAALDALIAAYATQQYRA